VHNAEGGSCGDDSIDWAGAGTCVPLNGSDDCHELPDTGTQERHQLSDKKKERSNDNARPMSQSIQIPALITWGVILQAQKTKPITITTLKNHASQPPLESQMRN
jgi:hypothetical protein